MSYSKATGQPNHSKGPDMPNTEEAIDWASENNDMLDLTIGCAHDECAHIDPNMITRKDYEKMRDLQWELTEMHRLTGDALYRLNPIVNDAEVVIEQHELEDDLAMEEEEDSFYFDPFGFDSENDPIGDETLDDPDNF